MTNDDRIVEVLLRWEELYEQGQDVPAEQMCHDCPELVEAVAGGIADLKRVAWVNRPHANEKDETVHLGGRGKGRRSSSAPFPSMLAERYRLEGLIGEGGFGEVWQGFDTELQRQVAIKIPHRERLARPEDAEAYLAEARILASL